MTLNLSEAKNHGCRPHLRGSVRRASGFVLTDKRGVVNTPFPTNVYDLVGILREWPGLAIEVTCSRQAWDAGL